MSFGAREYVKATQCAPGGSKEAALSAAQLLVLLEVADAVDDVRGYAFLGMKLLAKNVNMSEGHTRRLIATLVEMQRLRKYAALRTSDRSQSTNDYVLVGYVPIITPAKLSKAASSRIHVPRRRQGEDESLERQGGRQKKAHQLPLVDVHGSETVAEFGNLADVREMPSGEGRSVVEITRECSPPTNISGSPPANTRCLPIDPFYEVFTNPLVPLCPRQHGSGVEEKLPDMTKAGATARATATATASSREAVRVNAESGAGEGFRAGRAPRWRAADPAAVLQMEGEAAALELEMRRVMLQCGWTPGPLETTIRDALQLRMQSSRCSASEAGDVAVRRWKEYVEAGPYLRYHVQPKKFFREGIWLAPKAWPYDSRKLGDSGFRHPHAASRMF
jgi:hypothetical protein